MGLFKAGSREEFYYLLGNQEIVLNDYVVKTLKKQSSTTKRLLDRLLFRQSKPVVAKEENTQENRPSINMKDTDILRYDENGNGNFRFSDCCNPIPGDDVLGFVEENGSVVVHALDCPRANALKASFGPRIVSTRWEVDDVRFLAHVRIEGIDRHGILNELISLISSDLSLDIRALDIRAEKEVFFCDLSVMVTDVTEVNSLCAKVKKLSGVQKAARIAL